MTDRYFERKVWHEGCEWTQGMTESHAWELKERCERLEEECKKRHDEFIMVYSERCDLWDKLLDLEGNISTLFDKIKHGDAEHQRWLEREIREHFARVRK